MMGLRSHVAQAGQGAWSQFALDGKEVVFVVRKGVVTVRRRESRDGQECRKIDTGVGMALGSPIQLGENHRERLGVGLAIGSIDERRVKQGRRRAGITQAKRRLRLVYGDGVALDGRIENAEACADACLTGTAEDLAKR